MVDNNEFVNRQLSAKELIQYCQVVGYQNGHLSSRSENVKTIVGMADHSKFTATSPMAVIAITGSTGDEKRFLVNFLIDFLGNWEKGETVKAVGPFTDKRTLPDGLSAESNPMEMFLKAGESSGAYLWPEPFMLNVDEGRKLAVWLLQVQSVEEGMDSNELNEFLAAVSSRVVELTCQNDSFHLEILEPPATNPSLTDSSRQIAICLTELCDSTMSIFRNVSVHESTGSDPSPMSNPYKKVNTKTIKSIQKVLKTVLETVAEECKTGGNGVPEQTFGKSCDWIISAANKPQEHRRQREKARVLIEKCYKTTSAKILETFPYHLKCWITDKMDLSTISGMEDIYGLVFNDTIEAHRKKIPTPFWKEFVTLVDNHVKSNCQIITKTVSDLLIKFAARIVKQFDLLGYIPPNALDIQAQDEVEKVKAEVGEGVVLEIAKLGYEKLVRIFKDRDENVIKAEGNSFQHDVTQMRQVFEESLKTYLNNAAYNPQAIETCRSTLISQVRSEIRKVFHVIQAENGREDEDQGSINQDTLVIDVLRDLQQHAKNNDYDVKAIASSVMSVYQKHMTRYTNQGPCSPGKLQDIHSTIVGKLTDTFKMVCCRSTSFDQVMMSTAWTVVKEKLDEELALYKEINNNKLKKLQQDISKIIQRMKTQYNEKVEELLTRNPDGLDMKTLTKRHTSIQAEVMKLLEMELRTNIRSKEPIENHQKGLQNHIDSYWLTVVEENGKFLKKAQERAEKEGPERKKLESQRKLEEQQREAERRSKSASADPCCSSSASTRNCGTSEDGRPSLPPLVFHLQPSRIVMAMGTEGRVDILKNESGEEQTPAVIVYDNESFICGTEALAYITAKEISKGKFSWSLGDFFLENDLTWRKTFRIDDEYHDISDEFLLAFLLKKLKYAVESEMSGKCSTAILAIPFWLSSSQRIKIKDGAKLAGFSEIHLINEASAAAYNFVVGGDMRPEWCGYALVISESLDRVDAFVYDYNGYDKKIKMIGHSSNYSDEKRKAGPISKAFVKGVSSAISYVSSYITTEETAQMHRDRSISDACKLALDRARTELSCSKLEINESLFICENLNKWGMVLEKVARDFGRKVSGIKENTAVLFGAESLSNRPKEIGTLVRDKLAYDVLRFTSGGGVRIICKEQLLPMKLQNHITTLSPCHDTATFYQYISGRHHDIGEVHVAGVRYSQFLEPNLEITNEAIVRLKFVLLGELNAEYKSRIADEQVQWKTPNLSAERLDELEALLDFFTQPPAPKEDPELIQAKADLLQKCREMTEKIETDQFKIRSTLVKNMALKTISEARLFAEHHDSSLESVQKQSDGLEKLCKKYAKK